MKELKVFDSVANKRIKKSAFNLGHEVKMSGKMGNLMPFYLQEVVPGDMFMGRSEIMLRLAPTLAPIMHRVNVYCHFFYVPNRIVWDGWEEFIFPKKADSIAPAMPLVTCNSTTAGKGSLADYFGLPIIQGAEAYNVTCLPFRAYSLIWNEYYRDQNLQNEVDITATGLGSQNYMRIRQRAWEKDYFTSAFPTPQKGPAVVAPINGDAVTYKSISEFKYADGTSPVTIEDLVANNQIVQSENTGVYKAGRIENIDSFDGQMTIEELRRSARLQEWLERAMRAGTRYKEAIMSFFGVDIGDARLDRPEYIGGGMQPITISEVLNQTATSGQEPLGTMGGHGIAVGSQNKFKYTCKEHGYIMGILSVLPKTAYSQGIDRTWTRQDRYDYYFHEFANLGEQEIKNKELYFNHTTPDGTFGYQQRYAEYKYMQDRVSGDFRDTLDFWHLARQFDNEPALNEDFIKCMPEDVQRIFAVQDSTDNLWIQVYNDIKARRPMPYFADPTL